MPPVISPLPCDLTGSGETPKRKETARKILHAATPMSDSDQKYHLSGQEGTQKSDTRETAREAKAAPVTAAGRVHSHRTGSPGTPNCASPRVLLANSVAARLSVAERTNPPFPWLHRRLGEDHARKQLPTHCIGAACPVDIRLDRPGGRHGCAGSRIVVFPAGPTRQANTGNSSEHDSTEACLA